MTPADLLASLRARGVGLRAAGGRLFASPASALTPADHAALREHKAAILPLVAAAPSPSEDDLREQAIAEALDREAAEGTDPFPGASSWLFAPYQGVGAAPPAVGPAGGARRGDAAAGGAGEPGVRDGGVAGGHVGWLKESRGRWRAAASAEAWGDCWSELLRVGSLAPRIEGVVLPAGRRP